MLITLSRGDEGRAEVTASVFTGSPGTMELLCFSVCRQHKQDRSRSSLIRTMLRLVAGAGLDSGRFIIQITHLL